MPGAQQVLESLFVTKYGSPCQRRIPLLGWVRVSHVCSPNESLDDEQVILYARVLVFSACVVINKEVTFDSSTQSYCSVWLFRHERRMRDGARVEGGYSSDIGFESELNHQFRIT